MTKVHVVTVTDDRGWFDGCNDYWGVFFGGHGPGYWASRRKRDAERLARDLAKGDWRDADGSHVPPVYGVVTVSLDAVKDADDFCSRTGHRVFGEEGLKELREFVRLS